ncbi:MAG: riboflavin synthase subunit alpha [Betaproteobacteria bacterium RIFCSPLOWO2_12_FULL_62_13b]|nr:MAG: riboflavin synthase subunit alpha [Betaproteobacteria bacterium RIFCSPLOWO2_12_FULL_62_13b]
MFSGIVAAVGRITKVERRPNGVRLAVSAARLGMDDVAVGDSIAVNGVCLTVVVKSPASFEVDVSAETLSCTVGLDVPGEVNLEKALRLSDRLGGHLVSGHVDGVGEVVGMQPLGDNTSLAVRAPAELARYIARKGSVAVQGVSLTVNQVSGADFEMNLIPHTLSATTLRHLKAGSKVNLEVDLIARYVERLTGAS